MSISSPPEEWRPVVGYEGLYEVSDQGRVRSLDRVVPRGTNTLTVKGKELTGSHNKLDDRKKVELSRHGRSTTHKVHRLVAKAFLPVPENPLKVNVLHRDGNHRNNSKGNLYWGSQSENMYDRVRHGGHPNANKTHCPRQHPYAGPNLKVYRGMRYCNECIKEKNENRSRGF